MHFISIGKTYAIVHSEYEIKNIAIYPTGRAGRFYQYKPENA
jgi:hypothetical protein